ncbi:polyprenol phosphomannose-dependent alpha 1,6 mannosyltransferase MptB [Nonomuraea bangladeshensis]
MTTETRHDTARGRIAWAGMWAIGASVLLTAAIGLLGPSPMVPALGGAAWQPSYSLDVHPDPQLTVALGAAAIILGGLGLLTTLLALATPASGAPATPAPEGPATPASAPASGASVARASAAPAAAEGAKVSLSVSVGPAGVRRAPSVAAARLGGGRLPDGRVLMLLGCLAAAILAFLPPSGSGDHLNYAAYGRMVTLGINPYTHGAADLPGDVIADAVERPWREEPSVYGPVATAVQVFASWVGGDSLRLTIFVLALVNAAAFIVTALLIDRFTRHDEAARRRAALLWAANPLLLYHLVAGMHVDTLAVACMVAALLARGRPVGGGVLLGLGVAIKVNAGLVALGPAWELRRRPGRLAVMAGCALAVVVAGYAVAGTDAIAPVTRTSKAISHATVWKLVQGWLQTVIGTGTAYRGEIQVGSLLLLALLAWLLFRWAARTGWAWGAGAEPAGAAGLGAPVVAAGLAVAYVFASPYVLPWYHGLAFGMLALVAGSAVDAFLVVHLLALSLAYLPARVDGQPADLAWLSGVVRPQTAWVLLALTIALAVWAWRAAGRAHTPPASAAPPP